MHDFYGIGYRDGEVKSKARIAFLERLIEKYAAHVESYASVYFLESEFRDGADSHRRFTDEEWAAIRLLAKEDIG